MSIKGGRGALCVQMDFTRTFQTTTKCNNINHVALLLQLHYFEHLLQKNHCVFQSGLRVSFYFYQFAKLNWGHFKKGWGPVSLNWTPRITMRYVITCNHCSPSKVKRRSLFKSKRIGLTTKFGTLNALRQQVLPNKEHLFLRNAILIKDPILPFGNPWTSSSDRPTG